MKIFHSFIIFLSCYLLALTPLTEIMAQSSATAQTYGTSSYVDIDNLLSNTTAGAITPRAIGASTTSSSSSTSTAGDTDTISYFYDAAQGESGTSGSTMGAALYSPYCASQTTAANRNSCMEKLCSSLKQNIDKDRCMMEACNQLESAVDQKTCRLNYAASRAPGITESEKTLGYVALGLGAALLVLSLVAFIISLTLGSQDPTCPSYSAMLMASSGLFYSVGIIVAFIYTLYKTKTLVDEYKYGRSIFGIFNAKNKGIAAADVADKDKQIKAYEYLIKAMEVGQTALTIQTVSLALTVGMMWIAIMATVTEMMSAGNMFMCPPAKPDSGLPPVPTTLMGAKGAVADGDEVQSLKSKTPEALDAESNGKPTTYMIEDGNGGFREIRIFKDNSGKVIGHNGGDEIKVFSKGDQFSFKVQKGGEFTSASASKQTGQTITNDGPDGYKMVRSFQSSDGKSNYTLTANGKYGEQTTLSKNVAGSPPQEVGKVTLNSTDVKGHTVITEQFGTGTPTSRIVTTTGNNITTEKFNTASLKLPTGSENSNPVLSSQINDTPSAYTVTLPGGDKKIVYLYRTPYGKFAYSSQDGIQVISRPGQPAGEFVFMKDGIVLTHSRIPAAAPSFNETTNKLTVPLYGESHSLTMGEKTTIKQWTYHPTIDDKGKITLTSTDSTGYKFIVEFQKAPDGIYKQTSYTPPFLETDGVRTPASFPSVTEQPIRSSLNAPTNTTASTDATKSVATTESVTKSPDASSATKPVPRISSSGPKLLVGATITSTLDERRSIRGAAKFLKLGDRDLTDKGQEQGSEKKLFVPASDEQLTKTSKATLMDVPQLSLDQGPLSLRPSMNVQKQESSLRSETKSERAITLQRPLEMQVGRGGRQGQQRQSVSQEQGLQTLGSRGTVKEEAITLPTLQIYKAPQVDAINVNVYRRTTALTEMDEGDFVYALGIGQPVVLYSPDGKEILGTYRPLESDQWLFESTNGLEIYLFTPQLERPAKWRVDDMISGKNLGEGAFTNDGFLFDRFDRLEGVSSPPTLDVGDLSRFAPALNELFFKQFMGSVKEESETFIPTFPLSALIEVLDSWTIGDLLFSKAYGAGVALSGLLLAAGAAMLVMGALNPRGMIADFLEGATVALSIVSIFIIIYALYMGYRGVVGGSAGVKTIEQATSKQYAIAITRHALAVLSAGIMTALLYVMIQIRKKMQDRIGKTKELYEEVKSNLGIYPSIDPEPTPTASESGSLFSLPKLGLFDLVIDRCYAQERGGPNFVTMGPMISRLEDLKICANSRRQMDPGCFCRQTQSCYSLPLQSLPPSFGNLTAVKETVRDFNAVMTGNKQLWDLNPIKMMKNISSLETAAEQMRANFNKTVVNTKKAPLDSFQNVLKKQYQQLAPYMNDPKGLELYDNFQRGFSMGAILKLHDILEEQGRVPKSRRSIPKEEALTMPNNRATEELAPKEVSQGDLIHENISGKEYDLSRAMIEQDSKKSLWEMISLRYVKKMDLLQR